MKYTTLGISSRKAISIGFLVATIFIALLLSGIPMLISENVAMMPVLPMGGRENFASSLESTKTMPMRVDPVPVVLHDKATVPKEEKIVGTDLGPSPMPSSTPATKVFDQIFSMNADGEKFNVISSF